MKIENLKTLVIKTIAFKNKDFYKTGLFFVCLMLLSTVSFSQNYNPFVAQGIVSPSPLYDVASNGVGQISFNVGNTGDDPIPLITNQEMVLVISLSKGKPNNMNPIAAISGSYASHFNWLYDSVTKTYQGTQNQVIPDALTGGVGNIIIQYKVTNNSVMSSPQNGFNVNITPPPFANGINSVNDDQVSSYTWTIPRFKPHPDFGVTLINAPLLGNVSTNDDVLNGSTYGAAVAVAGNPSACMPIVSSSGAYTFNCATAGEYQFRIQVCQPAPASTTCISMPLVLKVVNAALSTNGPIANLDIATALQNTSCVIKVLSNDRCANAAPCFLNNPTIVTAPSVIGAMVTVNAGGTITYTPGLNYTGKDSFKYSVCDNQVPVAQCQTEWVYVTVLTGSSANAVNLIDDYAQTNGIATISGNVKGNDYDPEGNILIALPQTTTIAGKGTFTLAANGVYSFDPAPGFSGGVEFPYTISDNVLPQATAQASAHFLVASNLPLPVVMDYFTAQVTSCNVLLKWATLQEENSSHFNIQRKEIHENNFKIISKVIAAGNSSTPISYSFIDENISNGKYEYRLENVDIDGKFEMTETKLISLDCFSSIMMFPNPAIDVLNIKINSLIKEKYSIKMTDAQGRVIAELESIIDESSKVVSIPTSHLATAIYYVTVKGKATIETFKVSVGN